MNKDEKTTVNIKKTTRKKLAKLKLEKDLRSINDVIELLLSKIKRG